MRTFAMLITFATLFGVSSAASAQTMQRGTLSGVITSASAFVPQNSSVGVYTTPSGAKAARFILTQVCVEDSKEIVLSGNTMGDIVLDDDCTTFMPGIAVPVGEVLSFSEQNNGDQSGMITGILSKK